MHAGVDGRTVFVRGTLTIRPSHDFVQLTPEEFAAAQAVLAPKPAKGTAGSAPAAQGAASAEASAPSATSSTPEAADPAAVVEPATAAGGAAASPATKGKASASSSPAPSPQCFGWQRLVPSEEVLSNLNVEEAACKEAIEVRQAYRSELGGSLAHVPCKHAMLL